MRLLLIWLQVILIGALLFGAAGAGEIRVVATEPNGLVVEVSVADLARQRVDGFDRVDVSGWAWLHQAGAPAVPIRGAILGVPFGARIEVSVIDADYEDIPDVALMPVPNTHYLGSEEYPVGREVYERDRAIYGRDAFYPGEEAVIVHTGTLRDQRVAALSLRPVQYNPVRRVLRVARTLRVRVVFVPGAGRPALGSTDEGADGPFAPVYERGLLNAEQARPWRGRAIGGLGKQAVDWRDPLAQYYKVRIRRDGLYRMDAAWLAQIGVGPGDLDRLKLYVDGGEAPLFVDGDAVFFWGEYRRAPDRDFESEYGSERVYWLTANGGPGLRYATVAGAPVRNLPAQVHFTSHVHAEIDSMFEALGFAPDANRDHWYWQRTASPSRAGGVSTPVVMPVPLPGLAREAGGVAQIRLGMHGLSTQAAINPDHRTVVRLENGPVIAEDRWNGQVAFVASGNVSVAALSDTTRVVLDTPGDPSFPLEPVPYVDHVLFNWVTVSYPRRFEAQQGLLAFHPGEVGQGRTVSVSGLRSDRVYAVSPDLGHRVMGLDVAPQGNGFRAQFEVAQAGRYVVVDAGAVRVPDAPEAVAPSALQSAQAGAAYVVVTAKAYREAAERLAAHRQGQGLAAMVVDVGEIYDAFSFGQIDAQAVRRFVQHAYQAWTTRPAYVLLFGRFSFDYRDKFDQAQLGRRSDVPSLPFQSVNRGLAFTDEFFGRVDDDLFMDVFVGRFSVDRENQAQTVVQKTIGYDQAPPARWRGQMLFMANWDDRDPLLFAGPSNELSAIGERVGLESFKVYHDEHTPPEPNASSQEVIRQINEGRLLVNFMGHGSAASMSRFFAGTFQQSGFNYMSQINNGDRLPLFIGMSCLNGLFWEPRIISLAEEMTNKSNGGAVAYVSASSLAFINVNNKINRAMFRHMFENGALRFGQSLSLAKIDVLAQNPGVEAGVVMMNLIGDPAQKLALPDGPQVVVSDVRLNRAGELTTGDSVQVVVRLENWGVLPDRPVEVVLLDRNLDVGQTDTLLMAALPPFGVADSVAVLWRLAGRAGRHVLEAVAGTDRLALDVEVFGELTATPTLPVSGQVVTGPVRLGVRAGVGEGEALAEFELHTEPVFDGPEAVRSGLVAGADGLVLWHPAGLSTGGYFWRVRLTDGQAFGPWSAVQHFSVADAAPDRVVLWRQDGRTAFLRGVPEDVEVFEDGSARRVTQPPAMRFNAAEASFVAQGVAGTAVLCTDGTYVYVKRFYSSNALYPGTDIFERIGTGFNGTVAGQSYGRLTDVPIAGISATFHGDGFIYAEHQKAFSVLRISPATGRVDTVAVPNGLLDLGRGLPFDEHALITSDGEYIYNVSGGVNGVRRAGWSVQVFETGTTWRLVRSFVVAPTETGFGYLFTDGAIADGRFLYLIEFGTGLTHRVRVVDAQTGAFVAEFESDQAQTDILNGQYDWINNKVWLGQLRGPNVYQYPGRSLPAFGALTSEAIGPATGWTSLSLSLTGAGRAEVDILGETAEGAFAVLPGWQGLPALPEMDLTPLGASARRLKARVRLFGEGLNPSPGLKTWQVRYLPLSDIGLSNVRAEPREVRELEPVRLTVDVVNRGPIDRAMGASVAFYTGPPPGGRLIGRQAVPEDSPVGQVRSLLLVWQTAQFAGQHPVWVQVEDFQGRPAGRQAVVSDPVVIAPSTDASLPEIEIVALDALGEVRVEDYLPSEPAFRIVMRDTAGIDLKTVRFSLAGSGEVQEGDYDSGRIRDRFVTPTSLSFVYAPAPLADDRYTLSVQAFDRLGNGPAQKAMGFRVSSQLQVEQVLASPNPMAQDGAFTFVLSRPAAVKVRIFTVSGRLVQVLDDPFARAGYNQIAWNGRDGGGHLLANGVYLYTITADDGQRAARVKEKLIVYR